jgi:hypothetical protein
MGNATMRASCHTAAVGNAAHLDAITGRRVISFDMERSRSCDVRAEHRSHRYGGTQGRKEKHLAEG